MGPNADIGVKGDYKIGKYIGGGCHRYLIVGMSALYESPYSRN
jgi:hypothetical protein